jgi:hypothetical protein
MIELLVWCLTIYGMSNIGVYGKIMNGFRDTIEKWGNDEHVPFNKQFHFIREMMRCMMCLPVWIGFFFGIFLYSPIHELLKIDSGISWFFDGSLASGTTWMINSIVEWFEENRPNNQNNNQIL